MMEMEVMIISPDDRHWLEMSNFILFFIFSLFWETKPSVSDPYLS
jgi:hypothetical protein